MMFDFMFRRPSRHAQLERINDALWRIFKRINTMSDELVLLQTEVAETKAAVAVVIAGVADLKAKLAEAIAANDPTALVTMAAELDTLQAELVAAVAPPVVVPPVEPPVA